MKEYLQPTTAELEIVPTEIEINPDSQPHFSRRLKLAILAITTAAPSLACSLADGNINLSSSDVCIGGLFITGAATILCMARLRSLDEKPPVPKYKYSDFTEQDYCDGGHTRITRQFGKVEKVGEWDNACGGGYRLNSARLQRAQRRAVFSNKHGRVPFYKATIEQQNQIIEDVKQ